MRARKPIVYVTNDNGCHICISHCCNSDGYPVINMRRKVDRIFRIFYEKEIGAIPSGAVVRHTCDNKKCINTSHLVLGTHQQNVEDRVSRGRSAKGTSNGRAKLDAEKVLEIRTSTETTTTLAKRFGVDPKNNTVSQGRRDMEILVDQQEKAPWRFDCRTKVSHLETGDYSITGFTSIICIERKSLPDLVKTVVTDWQRFARQLRRMAAMDTAYVVCEAPVMALMEHKYSGDILPESVRGKINSIQLDFGVPTLFLDNREIAASWVHNLFNLFLQRRGMPSLTPLGKSKLPDLPFL